MKTIDNESKKLCYYDTVLITDKDIIRFHSKYLKFDCWVWTGRCEKDGYGRFDLGKKLCLSHRFMFIITFPEINIVDKLICHSCDNPICVNPNHLFSGTKKINAIDSVNKGRHSSIILRGESRPNRVLTEIEVLEIRDKYIPRIITMQHLADIYNVDVTTIGQIINRKTWTHI